MLVWAVHHNNIDLVRILLERGTNPLVKNFVSDSNSNNSDSICACYVKTLWYSGWKDLPGYRE